MIQLSDEQLQAIKDGKALRFTTTHTDFVVLRADVFDRLECVFDDSDFSPRQAYAFIDKTMAEDDANDPTLESYQKYIRES
jgi:hypothetical protein